MPLSYAIEKCSIAIGHAMTDPRDLGTRVGLAWDDALRHVNRSDFPTDELSEWHEQLSKKLGGAAAPNAAAAIAIMSDDDIAETMDLIRDLCLRTVKAKP